MVPAPCTAVFAFNQVHVNLVWLAIVVLWWSGKWFSSEAGSIQPSEQVSGALPYDTSIFPHCSINPGLKYSRR